MRTSLYFAGEKAKSHQAFSESNQIEVSQNAADSASPLSCSPECPQEEYVYDYQYAGSAGETGNIRICCGIIAENINLASHHHLHQQRATVSQSALLLRK